MDGERSYDLILFGASGFTGALTAEYLAGHAPPGIRWALAGRDRAKLERLREHLVKLNARASELDLLDADVEDPGSLDRLAASTRVLISTVGPYIRYGEPVVAACARAGTDYLDLTGEPEFVDLMYVRYDEAARLSGARIVHCCGFDSIPADLGVLFTVGHLPQGAALKLQGYVRSSASFSAGTFHSAVEAFARPTQTARAARQRRQLEPGPVGRQVRSRISAPRREPTLDGWAIALPTIDPQVVLRSARALERYGPDFTYEHNLLAPHLAQAAGLAGGVLGLFTLAQLPPSRRWLLGRMNSGEGPSPQRRQRAWFEVSIVGEGGGRRVRTQVKGGDPGYEETAKMLAESALCLAFDELPASAGQLTPAVAMGEPLIERLRRAGITFTVLQEG
ncbi:MAG TPA: saccharopine dehydrogenase NADP-binding domain-containing protein [Solirubrobacteraceae bacterium]